MVSIDEKYGKAMKLCHPVHWSVCWHCNFKVHIIWFDLDSYAQIQHFMVIIRLDRTSEFPVLRDSLKFTRCSWKLRSCKKISATVKSSGKLIFDLGMLIDHSGFAWWFTQSPPCLRARVWAWVHSLARGGAARPRNRHRLATWGCRQRSEPLAGSKFCRLRLIATYV